jgi:cold shock protein
VKWYNNTISQGLIPADDGKAVFVHFSAIQTRGFQSLEEGQRVEFTIVQGPNGFEARNVIVLQENYSG